MATRTFKAVVPSIAFIFLFLAILFATSGEEAKADFNPSYIISDLAFTCTTTMSEADIQTFLEYKGSYLANYYETRDSYIGPSNSIPVKGWRASKIIWQVANWYGVNPQVILATLQKEQSLVTNPSPPQWALDWAMGYGCPDSSPCASYPGFAVQVDWGTWQLRWNMDLANSHDSRVSPYITGNTITIDGTPVYLGNGATASLYRYTPHFHGNQNFAYFFESWFSIPLFNPFGVVDSVTPSGPKEVNVKGWAIDSDTADPIDIHIYLDGQPVLTAPADHDRPDVGTAFEGYGSGHGYDEVIGEVSPGQHSVCVYGINTGPGGNALLGCKSVTVPVNPYGSLDSATIGSGGHLSVGGWAIDPDVGGPVDVHFYMDGIFIGQANADQGRPDIGNAFPGFGQDHGFISSVGLVSDGAHTVCAYGINQGPGGNALLGCRTTEVHSSPYGSIDSLQRTTNGLRVTGWTIDPNTPDSIDVHVYVDGRIREAITAGQDRPDVGGAYPAYGSNHGFSTEVSDITSGTHTVCAYGINVGPGGNALLGCKAMNVVADPIGSLDHSILGMPNHLDVGGWAIDPNTGVSIDVHVYVDGQLRGATTAGQDRPDVGGAYPAYGSNHGFSTEVSDITSGTHTVCAYGINVGPGGNALLGCRTMTISSLSTDPFGSLDSVSVEDQGGGSELKRLVLSGWGIDPDIADPIDVHIYLDGQSQFAVAANQERLDVWVAYPDYGADHGFTADVIDISPGSHAVCVYGINIKAGSNALLGCQTATVD